MKKAWWWAAGVALVAVAAVLGVVQSRGGVGLWPWTAANAEKAKSGSNGDKAPKAEKSAKAPDKAASAPPLEFQAREIVKPAWAPMPVTLTFSGVLTAPSTATVRSKVVGRCSPLACKRAAACVPVR
jgi:hypothetical protein